ncbi:LysR family transcriptional regulator [Anderseniella sp. Alg231-50]|uniref:LysR family transcriptional regulator n=1 Tax=Anderseniella sp. Alg231-50 TaxID=1922226 RepID=UPI00307C2C15
MDRFDSMKALVTAVDEGGFAAAGRKLGLSRVQVSRLVTALEDHLGAQLLVRTTRSMALTEAGQVFVERARVLVDDMAEAEAAAGDLTGELKGLLQINAPMTFGVSHIAPAVNDFMRQHRDITVSLNVNDRFVDPYEEGFDITLRIGDLQPSSLIARKICPIRRLMCASPDYLEDCGRPRTPADLADHAILHYGHLGNELHWPLRGVGTSNRLPVSPVLCSNNGDVLKMASLAGQGIVLLPAFIVADELAQGTLVPVLEGFEPAPIALHAIYPPDKYRPAKTRAFVDFLTTRFQRRPPGGPV